MSDVRNDDLALLLLRFSQEKLKLVEANKTKNKYEIGKSLIELSRLHQRIKRLKIYLNTGKVLGPAEYFSPDFYLTISGIPAAIHITDYFAGYPSSSIAPEETEYVDFVVTDKNGYIADWLDKKITPENHERLYAKLIEEMRKDTDLKNGITPHIGHY